MQTKFSHVGNQVYVHALNPDTIKDTLKPQVYSVNFNPMSGYFLTIDKENFELPEKIYGSTKKRAKKVLKTYKDRTKSTGVLLTGDKGSGKTMLVQLLANKMIKAGVPVILIGDNYADEQFMSFINNIGECVLVFDEFAKMYKSSSENGEFTQEDLLTLFDGNFSQKRLILLTENDSRLLNDFMMNRPGRIFYHFKYSKLEDAAIIEYCKDNNISKKFTNDIVELTCKSELFSFDMLKAIVEEKQRYDESLEDIIADLNVSVGTISPDRLEILKVVRVADNTEFETSLNSTFVDKPDSYNTWIYIREKIDDVTAKDHKFDTEIGFSANDIKYNKNGQIIYETTGYVVVTKVLESLPTNFSTFAF